MCKKLQLVFCAILIGGCDRLQFKSNDGDKKTAAPAKAPHQVSPSSLSDSVVIRVEADAAPEKYHVYFSWPRIEDERLLRILTDHELSLVKSDQTAFNDEVFHNQTIHYM